MERVALESELAALKDEEEALEEEETKCVIYACTVVICRSCKCLLHSICSFWMERSRSQMLAARQKDSLASITSALIQTQTELTHLARTNVYNDAFCIGHDGPFGTVNGLRLGRVSGVNVEWAEINAAWGQAVLLLYTIARKVGFTFET
jgi:beclin 1